MGLFARTKSIALVSFLVSLLLLSAYGFLFYRIMHLNRAASEIEASIRGDAERDKKLREQQKLFEDLETDELSLGRYFVDTDGIVSFIESLERTAREARVSAEVASVGIEPSSAPSSVEWLKIAFRADGSWKDLFHFVMLLESMPHIIKLDQVGLSFEAPQDKKGAGIWRGTFILRAAKLTQTQL